MTQIFETFIYIHHSKLDRTNRGTDREIAFRELVSFLVSDPSNTDAIAIRGSSSAKLDFSLSQ